MLLAKDKMIIIGLGSNLGDCRRNLKQAGLMVEEAFQTMLYYSSIYRSEPVELEAQPWFLNQVAYFFNEGALSPTKILTVLKKIEQVIGRTPGIRYGPRLIDLDLLFFKNWIFESFSLTIPHPKITERSFVLIPLAEIAPSFIHPLFQKSVAWILAQNQYRLSKCELLDHGN